MISPIIVLLSLLGVVRAVNDWNTPCFNGECSWDLPANNADGDAGGAGTMVVVSTRSLSCLSGMLISSGGYGRKAPQTP
jgi:hypothetical protein